MAGSHAGAIATLPPATSTAPNPRKSPVLLSSLSSPFPSKRTRRTNHLRQKILKTLEHKPYPDTHKTQIIPVEETTQQQQTEIDQFSLSETTPFVDGIAGKFSPRSFVKIGLYLVGAFVLQTIFAVLIFGSNDIEGEDGESNSNSDGSKKARVLDLGANGKSQWKLESNSLNRNLTETKEGGIVLVDESELDKRVMEIQEMAREARELEAKKKGLVEEDDPTIVDRSVHEKEVNDRLMKLRKSLESGYEKSPYKVSRKDGVSDDVDKGMFKKKYKFKSRSVDSGDKPKGFDGITADNGISDNGDHIEQESIKESMPVSEPRNKLAGSSERAKTESITGTSKEPKYDKQAVRSVKSGKSSNLEARKPRGFGKEGESDTAISTNFNRNGGLKGKKGKNQKSAKSLEDMKSNAHTEFWWTRLPYVLGVLMQRGGDGEGLFTLRSSLESKSGLSHAVAFEDPGDATNFCYLLESFFEDLGDFNTDIIPIPTNELEEAVKSQMMKVVVVKKGQVKLYVGQPLVDVETALRALIEQNGRL